MEDNIQLGADVFNKMMFVLETPVTQDNHKYYKFMDQEMQEIADNIWAMPAYMKEDDDFSMFFIITEIESGETVIAFSEGSLQDGNFSLGEPMVSGKGLNILNEHDEKRASSVLHFLNQISKAAEGNWRMIED
ncbi:hypothetical protein ERK14_01900 [Lactobacillus kunkeei]|uniref:YdhG-like domain-containing protein n=1 Tax=Apilactobacillus nanyangensis TaxID=2799579 RepID=A0ABT0HXA7_9LACO|nr:hypothetical protein [Apilactobacillus nanyangensis]MBC6388315.1 hypothetical protein [Apilactobacillus kunkeei]MCK8611553.1 hypothetical protein [Apilactobacillus nanyangensis]TMT01814.1 hypothetical protein FD687_03740 [Apilactobacillus kunkeei]TMT03873.1 hypothetical protein FD689_03535 [Apilactobacillus kunkeei]CAI2689177.1 hypothetical protein AKUA1404_11770 [Apilactobacillus kunkeei]